jgi:hypothetical protein
MLGRAVEAIRLTPLLGKVWLDRSGLVLRTLVVALMLYGQILGTYQMWNDLYGGPQPPVSGSREVVSMRIDKKEPTNYDAMTWKSLDFTHKTMMRLYGPKPPTMIYRVAWNSEEQTLTLTKFGSPTWSATFSYDLPEPDSLKLQGSMDGKTIEATLRPLPEKRYELMNRGFHWIQELPYNR